MLNDKQERFCQEYLIDCNATQAAIRAGYSEKTAGSTGSENMQKPEIRARIEELQAEQTERTEITADFVLSGLKEVALRCLQKQPVMEWDYASKSMVQAKDENGNDMWQFDSQGANRALELLGKHKSLFTDKVQQTEVKSIDPESLKAIADKINANAAR